MGLLDKIPGMGGGEDAPKPVSATKVAKETADIQGNVYLPALTRLRGQYNPQLNQLAVEQAQRAQQGLSPILSDITGDISRDRGAMTRADMELFRDQSKGFAGAERLQALMQQMAEEELALGGRLSAEQERGVTQRSSADSARRGRGSGAFAVGQLALARQDAQQRLKNQRFGRGMQTIQSGLQMSNPLQRLMGINAQSAGTALDRLRNAQKFGDANTVKFDPLNKEVSGIAQSNFAQQSANYRASQAAKSDLLGGGMDLLGSIFGGEDGFSLPSWLGGDGDGDGSAKDLAGSEPLTMEQIQAQENNLHNNLALAGQQDYTDTSGVGGGIIDFPQQENWAEVDAYLDDGSLYDTGNVQLGDWATGIGSGLNFNYSNF